MNRRLLDPVCLVCLVMALAVAASALGQDPSPDPASGEATEETLEEPNAFLMLETDAPCSVWADNLAKGRLEPGTPREIAVVSGSVLVRAVSEEATEASWKETFEIEEGERREISIEMASVLEDLRKLERRERIYSDFDTRLMWPTTDNGADLTWEAAIEHCDEMRLGGFDDWRLPTVGELKRLQAMWSLSAYKTIGNIRLSACCPWTSDRAGDQKAVNFSFRHRRPFVGHVEYSYDLRALCVRDASAEIPSDKKEIARQRKLQKQRQKEREERKAARAERRDGR